MKVRAVYRDGHFIPEDPVDFPEGAEVRLTISEPTALPTEVTDPQGRRSRMRALVEDMANHPWPEDAPRLTRDEMHDRR